jgi:hypothetical protein
MKLKTRTMILTGMRSSRRGAGIEGEPSRVSRRSAR